MIRIIGVTRTIPLGFLVRGIDRSVRIAFRPSLVSVSVDHSLYIIDNDAHRTLRAWIGALMQ